MATLRTIVFSLPIYAQPSVALDVNRRLDVELNTNSIYNVTLNVDITFRYILDLG